MSNHHSAVSCLGAANVWARAFFAGVSHSSTPMDPRAAARRIAVWGPLGGHLDGAQCIPRRETSRRYGSSEQLAALSHSGPCGRDSRFLVFPLLVNCQCEFEN